MGLGWIGTGQIRLGGGDLSSVGEPIQKLTRKGARFEWGSGQQRAFEELKRRITNTGTLAYFDSDCQTRIVADASPVGLGAVLTQLQNGEWRVVSYASRSLTDVERRYSQTEREALALVWACERFNMYVYGREFELETDHKPLEHMYSTTSKPPARVERWVLRLQSYDFKVVYRPGKTNIADALSRMNTHQQRDRGDNCDFVRMVVQQSVPIALTAKEVEQASAVDQELNHVKECVRTGNWNECSIPAYLHVKEELSTYGELLLRGTRLVIPKSLQDCVLKLAHEGHQGIGKTKNRLRSKVWWPKIDSQAERLCRACHGCQVVAGYQAPEPMARVVPPSGPWQHCSADLLGPLPSGDNLLVIVDYYSRYFEVVIMKSTTSAKIVAALVPIFARFGVPYSLRTDNGPQFISEEWGAFLKEYGVEHRRTIPLWPQANGEVERQNRTLLKALRVAQTEGKDWRVEMQKLLTAYRSTPQVTTGATPFYMMFGREMKTKLPEILREATVIDEEIRDRDWSTKLKGKEYGDRLRHARESTVNVGDKVLIKSTKINKLSTNYDPNIYKVLRREGGEVTVKSKDGVEVKRNVTFVKKYQELPTVDEEQTIQEVPTETEENSPVTVEDRDELTESPKASIYVSERVPTAEEFQKCTRTRQSRLPKRFEHFVMNKK